jgi:hypothetical protein
MLSHWQRTLSYLEEAAASCRRGGIELVVVLVPAACQVSPALCQTVARRAGLTAADLDLELPQRRLALESAQQGAAVIDLLPALRASAVSPYARNESTWNDHGQRIAADAVGEWLERRFGQLVATTARSPVP